MKTLFAVLAVVTLSGCATLTGKPSLHERLLDCTERLAESTDAHIVDSSNVCLKVYSFEKAPRTLQ